MHIVTSDGKCIFLHHWRDTFPLANHCSEPFVNEDNIWLLSRIMQQNRLQTSWLLNKLFDRKNSIDLAKRFFTCFRQTRSCAAVPVRCTLVQCILSMSGVCGDKTYVKRHVNQHLHGALTHSRLWRTPHIALNNAIRSGTMYTHFRGGLSFFIINIYQVCYYYRKQRKAWVLSDSVTFQLVTRCCHYREIHHFKCKSQSHASICSTTQGHIYADVSECRGWLVNM